MGDGAVVRTQVGTRGTWQFVDEGEYLLARLEVLTVGGANGARLTTAERYVVLVDLGLYGPHDEGEGLVC